jgi:hypothetical protein
VSLTPELVFMAGRSSALKDGQVRIARDWRQEVVALTVSVTLH